MVESNPAPELHTAPIEWRNGIPVSLDFDDVYYSLENGLQETYYVFLQQNNLQQRWENLTSNHPENNGGLFSIAETGFGSGLNFLATCDLWLKTAPDNWRLQFISAELYPLKPEDLYRALQQWPSLKSLADQLMEQYPPIVPGVHQLHFAEGRITLTLLFGESTQIFNNISCSPDKDLATYGCQGIDAWFLDGFAPSKNPDMWSPELFSIIGKLSRTGATFATFTAAGIVRRGLADVGFTVKKVPGFGRKRDMLCGQKNHDNQTENNEPTVLSELPWYLNQKPDIPLSGEKRSKDMIVLGAGIAGCTTAVALKRRGFEVTVIDRHPAAGQEGSGNPQGIVYPKLSPRNDHLPRINLAALIFASRYYQPYWREGLGQQSGILVLPENEKAAADFQQIVQRFAGNKSLVNPLTPSELSETCGVALESTQGLFYPSLGWLPPQQLCEQLLITHQIPLLQADVYELNHCRESNTWQLLDNIGNSVTTTDGLVIANAHGSRQFEQTGFLPIKKIQGQISQLPATTASQQLNTVICGEGYITPAVDGLHSCGATYNRDLDTTEVRAEDHLTNLEQIKKTDTLLRGSLGELDLQSMSGRANFRCTTPDYLPIVGSVPKVRDMLDRFSFLRRDARKIKPIMGSYQPNLYINIGMGSRGLSYAPLTAEILAAEIAGEIPPLERELRMAMHPARFLIRDLKRNKI